MIDFADRYTEFAQFHLNKANVLVHFFGVPISLLGIYGILFSLSRLIGTTPYVPLDWLYLFVGLVVYLKMHLTIGGVTMVWVILLDLGSRWLYAHFEFKSGEGYSLLFFLGVMLFGYLLLVLGHYFLEGRFEKSDSTKLNLFVMPVMLTGVAIHLLGLYKEEFEEIEKRIHLILKKSGN